jgi:hypothetical protein
MSIFRTALLTGPLMALGLAQTAAAAPLVEIRNAAVRVIVVPEDRADIDIKVLKANPRLPLFVGTLGGATLLDGHLQTWFFRCHGRGQDLRVGISDKGDFNYDELPQVVIRTPMDVRIETGGGMGSGGAVSGAIGRAHSVSLSHGACGDWTIANVQDRLEARVGGSGDIGAGTAGSADLVISGSGRFRTQVIAGDLSARVSGSGHMDVAQAGRADLTISGSGDVHVGPVSDGLRALISGSGDLAVERLTGELEANVSGVGDIKVSDGHVSTMRTRISGSGDVSFGGDVDTLQAVISGRGDVRVRSVKGDIDKHVSGSGEVHIGP